MPDMKTTDTHVCTVDELRKAGRLVTKVGNRPVLVVDDGGTARAIDNRCPHLGFPLHQGSIEHGLVTCHWHHARFDLSSGCTLDLWADDADGYVTEIRDGELWVRPRPADAASSIAHLRDRLRQGMEDSYSLVVAKATLGLLDAGVAPASIARDGLDFGLRNRAEGWGAGCTVLTAMANLLDHLDPADHALALIQGLVFIARECAGQPPRFPALPLAGTNAGSDQLDRWYRQSIEGRNGDGAERVITSLAERDAPTAEATMLRAVTDHVNVDDGHTLDFTNKAFESLRHAPDLDAALVAGSLAAQTAGAHRGEEGLEWRHPIDLAALAERASARLAETREHGRQRPPWTDQAIAELADRLLGDDPSAIADAVPLALADGARPEQIARAIAYAAALRLVRFHTQNDHADWNQVHHAFTTANAAHQAIVRAEARAGASTELLRALVQLALRVYLDRFLNVPAARLPRATSGSLEALAGCWNVQGAVDEAGAQAWGFVQGGGDPAELVRALGHALLGEDAGFHWFQVVEAGVRQWDAWPRGSAEGALVLVGLARFLAAHTPTRRELPRVVHIARRLRRGEALYDDDGEGDEPTGDDTAPVLAG